MAASPARRMPTATRSGKQKTDGAQVFQRAADSRAAQGFEESANAECVSSFDEETPGEAGEISGEGILHSARSIHTGRLARTDRPSRPAPRALSLPSPPARQ